MFYKDNFYESDFIPKSELFEIGPMKELIPQKGRFIATAARAGSRFFVASGSDYSNTKLGSTIRVLTSICPSVIFI